MSNEIHVVGNAQWYSIEKESSLESTFLYFAGPWGCSIKNANEAYILWLPMIHILNQKQSQRACINKNIDQKSEPKSLRSEINNIYVKTKCGAKEPKV